MNEKLVKYAIYGAAAVIGSTLGYYIGSKSVKAIKKRRANKRNDAGSVSPIKNAGSAAA